MFTYIVYFNWRISVTREKNIFIDLSHRTCLCSCPVSGNRVKKNSKINNHSFKTETKKTTWLKSYWCLLLLHIQLFACGNSKPKNKTKNKNETNKSFWKIRQRQKKLTVFFLENFNFSFRLQVESKKKQKNKNPWSKAMKWTRETNDKTYREPKPK
mgnify:CR=1 FL=1